MTVLVTVLLAVVVVELALVIVLLRALAVELARQRPLPITTRLRATSDPARYP